MDGKGRIKAMSLFSNVGIAESLLKESGVDVLFANEFVKERADFYRKLYPDSLMVNGDIRDKEIKKQLIMLGKEAGVDLIIATPPCQGMSAASAGLRGAIRRRNSDENEGPPPSDIRNVLIKDAVEIIRFVKPKYLFFENVPEQLSTYIEDDAGNVITIPNYIQSVLGNDYNFNLGRLDEENLLRQRVLNSKDYGVCQSRKRAIILGTRNDLNSVWEFPEKQSHIITMGECIGNLPSLDPDVSKMNGMWERLLAEYLFPDYEKKRLEGLEVSPYHRPNKHSFRHAWIMMHTPSGMSAFDNDIPECRPVVEEDDGNLRLIHGYKSAYKRQAWDKPAATVTMNNMSVSSQNNVHPGRRLNNETDMFGFPVWSDARVLTLYEIMLVSSLPPDWKIPEGYSEKFVRGVIGEGIPPKMVSEIMKNIPE